MEIENSLRVALQENFNHARHQESQRQKAIYSYLGAWGAVVMFSYTKNVGLTSIPNLFLLLTIIGIPVLIGCLKWSAEFGNHMAAIRSIAIKLNLNVGEVQPENKKISTVSEPTGFVGLPLKTNLMNVAPMFVGIICSGISLSTYFTLVGYFNNETSGSNKDAVVLINGLYVLFSFGVFIGLSIVSFAFYRKVKAEIDKLLEEGEEQSSGTNPNE